MHWIDKTIAPNANMEKNRSPNTEFRGPLDWVFPAWSIYIEYSVQRIVEVFQLTEEERRQLLGFNDIMRGLLQKAHEQAKTKLTSIRDAIDDGSYRLEGGKLHAPDGAWMYASGEPFTIEGVDTVVYFPDVMKLPREELELFQLGWEVHEEEGEGGHPVYATADPALFLAWAAARFGELHVAVTRAILLRDGVAVEIRGVARSWRKRWSKKKAEKLVEKYARRGIMEPFFTMWLGE
jgi:hypothetical protein